MRRAFEFTFHNSLAVVGLLDQRLDVQSLLEFLGFLNPISQAPERVAKRNYYYCYRKENEWQFVIEQGLQKLEDAALPILLQLRTGDFALNPDDRLTFAGYVALSHTRVPAFESAVNKIAELTEARRLEFFANNRVALKTLLTKHEAETGEQIDVKEFQKKLTGGNVVAKQTERAWSIKQMLTSMMALQKLIFQLHWSFLTAPADSDGFLTSDNPVSLFDPVAGLKENIGFARVAAAHLTFPIGKGICLLAQFQPSPRSVQLTASEVRRINKGTITRADGQLYAPFNSRAVQELFDYVSAQKKQPRRILLKRGRVVEE